MKGYVKQEGFTLIELIVVIVILGILAVTAAPKFIDLQGDARASTLQGLAGAMKGAATLVHGKALVANKVSILRGSKRQALFLIKPENFLPVSNHPLTY